MPGIKPKSGQGLRSQGAQPHGFARQPLAVLTHRVEHALEACPQCGTGQAGGWVQRTRCPASTIFAQSHSLLSLIIFLHRLDSTTPTLPRSDWEQPDAAAALHAMLPASRKP